MSEKLISVKFGGSRRSAAYVRLPGHRLEPGIAKKTVRIERLIENYKGPMVNFDFNAEGVLIGIEVVLMGVEH